MKLKDLFPFTHFDVDDEWGKMYEEYVPLVIADAGAGKMPDEWSDMTFYHFLEDFGNDHPIATLRQGQFTLSEREEIKSHWKDWGFCSILQKIAQSQDTPCWDLYDELENTFNQHTRMRHVAAISRMVITLQPKLFSSIASAKYCDQLVALMRENKIENFDYENYNFGSDVCGTLRKNYMIEQFLIQEYGKEPIKMTTIAWRLWSEFSQKAEKKNREMEDINQIKKLLQQKKQIILQGAPGTGKTYSTAKIALAIIGCDVDLTDHKAVMEKYQELHDEGQIEFVTFHMSMDYEDFVEGIKPITEDNKIVYEVEDGIFKRICDKASERTTSNFDATYEQFLRDISETTTTEPFILKTVTGKEFGVCPNSRGNLTLMTGKNFQQNGTLTKENIERIAKGHEDNGWASYYRIIITHLKEKYHLSIKAETTRKNFVLIIDEINRGNISKIFGELITLLEADKRAEGDHPLTVRLPYSKESFSVPDNLYIIGTMNTTDRSVGSLDYALRRRFAFVTVKSDENILEKYYAEQKWDGEIAKQRFAEVKQFLQSCHSDMDIDDLMVGHSFFMAEDEDAFMLKWHFEILPLLDEYFKDGIINKKYAPTEGTTDAE